MNMRKITLVLALVLAMLLSVSLAYADGYTAKVNADVEIPVAVDGPIVYVAGEYSADEPVPFTVEWFTDPSAEDAEPYAVLNMLLLPDGKLNVTQDTQFSASLREVLALQIAESDADHQWNSGVELAPADCQNQGIVMAECKDCYAMKFSLINGSHAYGAWQTVTKPTCTEVGTRKMTCSVCGSTLQEEIDMLDHTPMIDEAVAPTHTETGLTVGSHCSVCGETLVAQEVIPATGYSVFMTIKSETFTSVIHDQYAAMMIYAPDGLPIESKDGYTFVGYRSDAGTLYKVGELIPMDEFTEQDDAYYINLTVAFEKDETEDPDVLYTDANSYTARLTIVSPIAYDLSVTTETYTFDPAKETSVGTVSYPSSRQLAMYVRKGLTPIGFRSLVTGNVFSIGDVYALDKLPAATYVDQTVTDVSETEKLRVTNYEINDKLVPLYSFFGASGAFLDHLYSCEITFYVTDPIDDSQSTSAPVTTIGTQTISGITMDELTASDYAVSLKAAPAYDGYVFNGYGLLTGSSVLIDGNQLVLNDVIADLAGQNGQLHLSLKLHYSIDTRCPGCGAENTAVITEAQDPTCTEPGLSEGKHCSTCGTVLVAQEIVDPLGHTVADDDPVAPTCTEPGLTEGKHCSVCNTVLVEQEEIAPLGHAEVTDAPVDATCTTVGLTEGKHCSVCNAVLAAQEEIAPLGHTEVTDPGYAATCTTAGLTEGKHCSVCNAVLVAQEEIAPLGHTEAIDAAVAPTCTDAGLIEGKHCSVCSAVLVKQEEIPAAGHQFDSFGKCNTCQYQCPHPHKLTTGKYYSDAYHHGTCDVCNGSQIEEHTIVIDAPIAPTCSSVGLTEGKHCSVCNTVLVAQTEIPTTAHGFNYLGECLDCGFQCPHPNGVSTAKYYSDTEHSGLCDVCKGYVHLPHTFSHCVCTLCGFEKHTPETVEAKDPTCTVRGYTAGTRCSVCQKVLNGIERIPPLGCDFECVDYAYTHHYFECTRCHFQKSEPHRTVEGYCDCVVCGYKIHDTYAYAPVDSSEHRTYCTRCGDEVDRFFHSGSPCEYCGYETGL